MHPCIGSRSKCPIKGDFLPISLQIQRIDTKSLKKVPFDLKMVDITKDSKWFEQFKYDIPVFWINGKEVGRHRLEEGKIVEYLQKEMKNIPKKSEN